MFVLLLRLRSVIFLSSNILYSDVASKRVKCMFVLLLPNTIMLCSRTYSLLLSQFMHAVPLSVSLDTSICWLERQNAVADETATCHYHGRYNLQQQQRFMQASCTTGHLKVRFPLKERNTVALNTIDLKRRRDVIIQNVSKGPIRTKGF